MIVELLTEHHLEFLSLEGGCRGSSESTMSKCQLVRNPMPRLNYLILYGMQVWNMGSKIIYHHSVHREKG